MTAYSLRFRLVCWVIRRIRYKQFYFSKSGEEFWRAVESQRTPRGSRPSRFHLFLFRVLGWKYEEVRAGNTPVFILTPRKWNGKRTVLYIHGGGYVNEALNTHWNFVSGLSRKTSARIVFPQYPLAPEFTCVDAISALREVYETLLQTTKPEEILFMGDSAGGGLTLALAMEARESGLPQPRHLVMLSPSVEITPPDLETDAEARELNQRDLLLSFYSFSTLLEKWKGTLPEKDWRVQAMYGNLQNLAPMTLITGTADILNRGARLFQNRVAQEPTGTVSLEYIEQEGMFHCWVLIPMPESKKAIEKVRELVRARED